MNGNPPVAVADKLDRIIDGFLGLGITPKCVYLTLDEWAWLSVELGAPRLPVDAYRGIPIHLSMRRFQ